MPLVTVIRITRLIGYGHIISLYGFVISGYIIIVSGNNLQFLIIDNHVKNKKYGNVVSITSLTCEYAAQKLKKTFAVLVYGHVRSY